LLMPVAKFDIANFAINQRRPKDPTTSTTKSTL